MKAFFLSKYFVSSSYFLTSPTLNFFLFLPKNLKNKVERHFLEKIPFETHSRKKLPQVAIVKKNFKVFSNKPNYFSEKPPNFERLRILTIPVAFYSKFATIWWKNNFRFRREQNADVGVNAIGKHQVKKRRKWPIWVEDFAFIFLRIWRKIINILFIIFRNVA